MPPRSRHDKPADEWFRQADQDFRAAEHLTSGGFHAHASVFVHLAVEKALKGLYKARLEKNPPITHDLKYLVDRLRLTPPRELQDALDALSAVSILTLYPDRVFQPAADEDEGAARRRLADGRALLDWIGDQV